jgi:hypothetical protein
MTNGSINSLCDQLGRPPDPNQSRIISGSARFTTLLQEPKSWDDSNQRKDQAYPRNDLRGAERILKPIFNLDQDDQQNGFPGKEVIEAMRTKTSE